jgi:endoglycosylceramidase
MNRNRAVYWPLMMASDPTTYRSFADFYSDAHGVRSCYLNMVARLAMAFAPIPGVIGYDLLNEPWGDECRDLAPLYRDAAAVIHSRHPTAFLFLEGQFTTNCGIQTRLPRLAIPNVVYAPHYYKPIPILLSHWYGVEHNIGRAFAHMTAIAEAWNVPLFVGEFGMPAHVASVDRYMTAVHDHLDAGFVSGAQWNFTPCWTEDAKDGWNGEDYNILDHGGAPRSNFALRPYPRFTAGVPLRLAYLESSPPGCGPLLQYDWIHMPERGETEIFVPASLFPPGTAITIAPAAASWLHDPARQVLLCRCPCAGTIHLTLCGPPLPGPAPNRHRER